MYSKKVNPTGLIFVLFQFMSHLSNNKETIVILEYICYN